MREEIREHRFEQAKLVPPHDTRPDLARRKSPVSNPFQTTIRTGLPFVLVDSEEKLRIKKKSTGFCRRYCVRFVSVVAAFVLLDFLDDMLFTPTSWRPEVYLSSIRRDYSTVSGLDELSSEFVQPWCFNGRTSCSCKDPLIPEGRQEFQKWEHVRHLNVENALAKKGDVDVLFLGDSITEGWGETSYGQKSARTHGVLKVFESLFSNEAGGQYEGLALGISGDTSPNLLWRTQNGELPDSLSPSVIWLLIGTNDFGRTWCSGELVVIGVIRIVEELLRRRPGSTIVINSILPRSFHRKGYVTKGRRGRWWRSDSRPALPSLWDDIEEVNDELQNYATNRHRVRYADTVDLFFQDSSVARDHLRIDKRLMPDYLHPSAEGYRLWGERIVTILDEIVPKR